MIEEYEIAGGRWGTIRAMDASTARKKFRDVIDVADRNGQRLIITRNGRPAAAMISLPDLEVLLRGDAEGERRLSKVLAVTEPPSASNTIPFDKFVEGASNEPPAEDEDRSVADLNWLYAPGGSADRHEIPATSLTDFMTVQIALKASNAVLERMKERHPLDADEKREIQVQVLESVRSSVVELKEIERLSELAESG